MDIQKLDIKRQVLQLALQGFDADTIAEQLSITQNRVKSILTEGYGDLSERVQALMETHLTRSYARLEKIISRVMPAFDDPNLSEKTLRDYATTAINVIKAQSDLLRPNKNAAPTMAVQINTTISGSDELYQHAINSMMPDTFDSPTTVTYDPRVDQIAQALGLEDEV